MSSYHCISAVVHSHDRSVSVEIDMALSERHWLVQNIVTGPNAVYIQHEMVLHNTEDALVVVHGFSGHEAHFNASLAFRRHCAYCFAE